MKRWFKIAAVTASVILGASACGGSGGSAGGPPDKVNIAVGSGIAYAPLTIMKSERMLEERFPQTDFTWQLGVTGGAATRSGMLSDQIQIGVAGIAPFLVGFDRGVDWKVLGSMGQLPIQLVAIDPAIRSLDDLRETNKSISLPSPDSGQAIALRALAQREFGDPTVFNDQLASMGHPEAFQALLSGTTGAAFIGPPFYYRLLDEHGARRIAGAWDVFGPMTYTAVVMMQDFHDENQKFAQGVFQALQQSLAMLRERPQQAARILVETEKGSNTAEQYQTWLTKPKIEWSVTPRGYQENAKFMQKIGLISDVPQGPKEWAFPTVAGGK